MTQHLFLQPRVLPDGVRQTLRVHAGPPPPFRSKLLRTICGCLAARCAQGEGHGGANFCFADSAGNHPAATANEPVRGSCAAAGCCNRAVGRGRSGVVVRNTAPARRSAHACRSRVAGAGKHAHDRLPHRASCRQRRGRRRDVASAQGVTHARGAQAGPRGVAGQAGEHRRDTGQADGATCQAHAARRRLPSGPSLCPRGVCQGHAGRATAALRQAARQGGA